MRVVVVGTGTEIGKTWVSVSLVGIARESGLEVTGYKPAQSFDVGDSTTDADQLGAATGQDPYEVCPQHRWYELALAPPMAASELGRPEILLGDLAGEVPKLGSADIQIIETAGGVRSPICADGDSISLIDALSPDQVVLVADGTLGTLNSIVSSLDSLGASRSFESRRVIVMINRFDNSNRLHQLNRDWLTTSLPNDVVVSANELFQILSGDSPK